MRTILRLLRASLAVALCGTGAPVLAEDAAGFDVTVVLTKTAAATLAARRESIVLMVDYYGWPKTSAARHADEIGQIGFGPTRTIAAPGRSGTYRIPGETLDAKRLGWLDGPVLVNVNIASARASGPDNLLDCEIIDMPLAEAARAANALHCGLIEGDPDSPR